MICDITAYGAIGDGKMLATNAIQAAIDACHQNGGGRVSVPAGVFKTGTIWLKSHVELHLEMGATLLASEDLADYNAEDAYVQNFRSNDEEWCGKHLVIALEAEDVALTGLGRINGNAECFYDVPEKKWHFLWMDGLALAKDKQNLRPGQLICFIQCKHVRVQDIHIENNTCWCCFFHGCEFVQVRGVCIQNQSTYANTDGIDIDTCRYVTVSDCLIDTADDAFAIRGSAYRLTNKLPACEYVSISNCVLGSSSGAFRIGVGDSPIRHVRVSNIVVKRAATAFILTSNYSAAWGRYTPTSDISFQNVSVADCSRVLKFGAAEKGVIRDVSFHDVHAVCTAGSYMESPEGKHIQNVRFENFTVEVKDKGKMPPDMLTERRAHVIWMQNVAGGVLRHMQIRGADQTAEPWEAEVMAEGCELLLEDCNVTPNTAQ